MWHTAVAADNTQIAICSAPNRVVLRGRVTVITSSGIAGEAVAGADGGELRISSVSRHGRRWSGGQAPQDAGGGLVGSVAPAHAGPQVHVLRVAGGGRGLAQRAGQVVQGRVAGQGAVVEAVREAVAQAAGGPSGEGPRHDGLRAPRVG